MICTVEEYAICRTKSTYSLLFSSLLLCTTPASILESRNIHDPRHSSKRLQTSLVMSLDKLSPCSKITFAAPPCSTSSANWPALH